MREKTILLTGVTGFLGGHLARLFLERGDRVVALARGSQPRDRAERAIAMAGPVDRASLERLEVLEGDVAADLSPLARRLAGRVDEVWHSAVTFQYEERHRDAILATNVDGTRNVLDLALRVGRGGPSRFFYVSTSYVCGRQSGTIEERLEPGERPFNNLYEWSKHEAEQLVASYRAESGLQGLVFRPSIVVGHSRTGAAFNHSGYYQVFRAFYLLRRSLEINLGADFDGSIDLRLLGNGRSSLNVVPIDFVVQAMALAAEAASPALEALHLTNEQPPELDFMLEVLCEDLRIRGVRFAPQEEFDRDPMDAAERLFQRRIGFQAPYVRLPEMRFSTTSLRRLVPAAALPAPVVDRDFLHRINRHYLGVLDAEFGRN